jgi:hypothetical protein
MQCGVKVDLYDIHTSGRTMKVATIGSLILGLENMATGKLSSFDQIMMFRKTRQIEMRHSAGWWE